MKEDVEKGLPPKEETLIDVELTGVQKQYYRYIFLPSLPPSLPPSFPPSFDV